MADDLTTPLRQQMLYGIALTTLAGIAAFAAIVLTGDATGIRLLVAGVAGVATSTLLFIAANQLMYRSFQKRLAASRAERRADAIERFYDRLDGIEDRHPRRRD